METQDLPTTPIVTFRENWNKEGMERNEVTSEMVTTQERANDWQT